MASKDKSVVKTYRTKKKVISDCVKSGAMTKQEAFDITQSLHNKQYRVVSYYKTKQMAEIIEGLWQVADDRDVDKRTGKKVIDNQLLRRQLMTLETAYIEKPDISLPSSVEKCCKTYFTLCLERNQHFTLAGLILALGITKTEFQKILNGEKLRHVQPILEQAYQILNAQLESDALSGKVNPMIIAYIGNNNFGYSDKKEIKVTTNKTEDLSDEELMKKYVDVEVVEDN